MNETGMDNPSGGTVASADTQLSVPAQQQKRGFLGGLVSKIFPHKETQPGGKPDLMGSHVGSILSTSEQPAVFPPVGQPGTSVDTSVSAAPPVDELDVTGSAVSEGGINGGALTEISGATEPAPIATQVEPVSEPAAEGKEAALDQIGQMLRAPDKSVSASASEDTVGVAGAAGSNNSGESLDERDIVSERAKRAYEQARPNSQNKFSRGGTTYEPNLAPSPVSSIPSLFPPASSAPALPRPRSAPAETAVRTTGIFPGVRRPDRQLPELPQSLGGPARVESAPPTQIEPVEPPAAELTAGTAVVPPVEPAAESGIGDWSGVTGDVIGEEKATEIVRTGEISAEQPITAPPAVTNESTALEPASTTGRSTFGVLPTGDTPPIATGTPEPEGLALEVKKTVSETLKRISDSRAANIVKETSISFLKQLTSREGLTNLAEGAAASFVVRTAFFTLGWQWGVLPGAVVGGSRAAFRELDRIEATKGEGKYGRLEGMKKIRERVRKLSTDEKKILTKKILVATAISAVGGAAGAGANQYLQIGEKVHEIIGPQIQSVWENLSSKTQEILSNLPKQGFSGPDESNTGVVSAPAEVKPGLTDNSLNADTKSSIPQAPAESNFNTVIDVKAGDSSQIADARSTSTADSGLNLGQDEFRTDIGHTQTVTNTPPAVGGPPTDQGGTGAGEFLDSKGPVTPPDTTQYPSEPGGLDSQPVVGIQEAIKNIQPIYTVQSSDSAEGLWGVTKRMLEGIEPGREFSNSEIMEATQALVKANDYSVKEWGIEGAKGPANLINAGVEIRTDDENFRNVLAKIMSTSALKRAA